LYARENRNVFSLDLNVPSELLSVTVLGREFQVAGTEQRKARLAKAVPSLTILNKLKMVGLNNSRSSSSAVELAGADVTSVEGLAGASLLVLLLRAATAARLTVESPLLLRARPGRTILDRMTTMMMN